MAEAVLATALALPLVFAFAELRDSRLARVATTPPVADYQADVSAAQAAGQASTPIRVVVSGGTNVETSEWDAPLAILSEVVRLVSGKSAENAAEGTGKPESSYAQEVGQPAEASAEGVTAGPADGPMPPPTHGQSPRTDQR